VVRRAWGIEHATGVLRHHDILLPHWRELADAVQLHVHAGASRSFAIENIQLTSTVFNMLAHSLKMKNSMALCYKRMISPTSVVE